MSAVVKGYYEENAVGASQTAIAPIGNTQTPPGVGMWLLMGILLLNFDAVQKYADQGLAPLVETTTQLNLDLSDRWLAIMQGDVQAISEIIKKKPEGESAKINEETSIFNLHSTTYNKDSTFFNAISQGGQQNIGNENDITGLIIKMFQDGPLSTINVLFR